MPRSDPSSQNTAWEQVKSELLRRWPVQRWNCVGVLVGCSGGADSVALLRMLAEIRGESPSSGFLVVAHFDHGLRGDASLGDADFVARLADELGLKCVISSGDGERTDEAHLRQARRDFLSQTANDSGCRYVALAHSRDDNVETVLHHLFRGTGPAGLAGISAHRAFGEIDQQRDLVLIRPLLSVSRTLIRDAMRVRGFPWREDSSNQDEGYRRNWIRNKLIPLIETKFPDASEAVSRAAESQAELVETLGSLASIWMETFVSDHPVSIRRRTSRGELLRGHPLSRPPVVIAALQAIWNQNHWPLSAMTQTHWLRIVSVVENVDVRLPDQFQLPGNIWCRADEQQITLERRDNRIEAV